ncbi:MAG: hypothetical protein IJX88_05595 [Clostridia bacterium]|nr:hypothetical protein [Clostridia bacterium]
MLGKRFGEERASTATIIRFLTWNEKFFPRALCTCAILKEFWVGFTACEGINCFYSFAIEE